MNANIPKKAVNILKKAKAVTPNKHKNAETPAVKGSESTGLIYELDYIQLK